jgi:hypothetical protein
MHYREHRLKAGEGLAARFVGAQGVEWRKCRRRCRGWQGRDDFQSGGFVLAAWW